MAKPKHRIPPRGMQPTLKIVKVKCWCGHYQDRHRPPATNHPLAASPCMEYYCECAVFRPVEVA